MRPSASKHQHGREHNTEAEPTISAANSPANPGLAARNSAADDSAKRHPSDLYPTIIRRQSGDFRASKWVFSLLSGEFRAPAALLFETRGTWINRRSC